MTTSTIRPVARAIIVGADGRVLTIEVDDGAGRWWILPGGKQEFGETAAEAVNRECKEELRCEVEVGACVMVREFIGPRRSQVVGKVGEMHSLELYFRCTLKGTPDLKPSEKFHRQIAWTPATELVNLKFFPKVLASQLPTLLTQAGNTAYVGDAD